MCLQVIMSNKEAAERACKEPNPIIDGRKANVNLAILGAKPRGNLTGTLPYLILQVVLVYQDTRIFSSPVFSIQDTDTTVYQFT